MGLIFREENDGFTKYKCIFFIDKDILLLKFHYWDQQQHKPANKETNKEQNETKINISVLF